MKKVYLVILLMIFAFLANAQFSPITINPSGTVVNTNVNISFTNNLIITSIVNSPWITTNAFTSLISSSNFVKATVTNGLTGNSNNFYGTFGTIIQPVYSTTTSLVVSGITNSISPALILTNFNGTYYWSNSTVLTLSYQGLWVNNRTNYFGYVSGGGFSAGWGFTTNYLVDTTYIVDNFGAYWGTTNGTTTTTSGFTGSKSPIQFYFTGGASSDQNVTFTLPVSTAAATNLFTPTAISLMAASGNTNLLISNNDPWFPSDKNPTLDVSGSVDQALVIKGSFYVTSILNGNGKGLTNLSLPYTSITNSPWITTNALTSLITSSNFVTASVTNGLATTAFVYNIGANTTNYANAITNGLVTASVTNGLATTSYVTGQGYITNNPSTLIWTNNNSIYGNGVGITNLITTNLVAQSGFLAAASAVTNYTINLLSGEIGNIQQVYLANANCFITFTGTNVADTMRSVLFRGWTNTTVSTLAFVLPSWHTNYTVANYYVTNGQAAIFNFYNPDTSGTNVMISDGGRWK